jgi:hypothetical protein
MATRVRTFSTPSTLLLGSLCFAGAPASPLAEYEFVPDTSPWFVQYHGDLISLGHLDKEGNFIPDPQYCNIPPPLSSIPPNRPLNAPYGPAFEYRSGRLIPGELDKRGNFVPEVGGKIISLEDYRPGPKAMRIYNLPGRFVKKEQKDGK